MGKKRYIVWNADRTEGVIFEDEIDAKQAHTGKHGMIGCALAEDFHDLYGDDNPILETATIHTDS